MLSLPPAEKSGVSKPPELLALLHLLCLACLLLVPIYSAEAQGKSNRVAEAVQALDSLTAGSVQVTRSPVTGVVTFISTREGLSIPTALSISARAEDIALNFLTSYGDAFGLGDLPEVRVIRVEGPDKVGMQHVRFQQMYMGIPVTGGGSYGPSPRGGGRCRKWQDAPEPERSSYYTNR